MQPSQKINYCSQTGGVQWHKPFKAGTIASPSTSSSRYQDNTKKNTTAINALYYSVRNAIRAYDTERIIIFAPCKLSNPDYLQYLNFTEANDPYTMAEWHFYASGPKTDPSNKKYWNDGSTAQ